MEEQEVEQQEIVEQEIEKPKTTVSINNKNIEIGSQMIIGMFAILAALLMIVYKVYWNFNASTFAGIMSLLICLLTFSGVIWAYLRNKKFSLELGLNLGLFLVAIAFM